MKEYFRLHAEICRAISHPKRLEILSLLRDEERSVGDLAGTMKVSSSNVSQQLAILRRSGVLERRHEGTTVYYRIKNLKILQAYDLMTEALNEQIDQRFEALGKGRPNRARHTLGYGLDPMDRLLNASGR